MQDWISSSNSKYAILDERTLDSMEFYKIKQNKLKKKRSNESKYNKKIERS